MLVQKKGPNGGHVNRSHREICTRKWPLSETKCLLMISGGPFLSWPLCFTAEVMSLEGLRSQTCFGINSVILCVYNGIMRIGPPLQPQVKIWSLTLDSFKFSLEFDPFKFSYTAARKYYIHVHFSYIKIRRAPELVGSCKSKMSLLQGL